MNQIETKPTDDLIPYERNPKAHPDSQIEQLANSIVEWGWTIPILVDEHDNVIAGHGRLYAAQRLGLAEVPCIVARGWSDKQKQAYVIADNKLAENGNWDMGLFYSELKQISDQSFDLNLLGVEDDMVGFSPSLDPSTSLMDITDEQVDRASDVMGRSMLNVSSDKSLEGVEVMCPSCAHSFRFTGS